MAASLDSSAWRWLRSARGLNGSLVSIFLAIGLVPFLIVSWIAVTRVGSALEYSTGTRMQTTAQNSGELIDRNLFERYGDVQAFAANLDGATLDPARAGNVADLMIKLYGIYDLMIVTDAAGTVVAVNSRDFSGDALDTQQLVGEDMSGEPWFQAIVDGSVSAGETHYTEPEVNPFVHQIYGDDRLTLPFTAPILGPTGDLVGVWHNQASFDRIVGEILVETRDDLQRAGVPSVEAVIVDPSGRVLGDSNGGGTDRSGAGDATGLAAAVDAQGFLAESDPTTGLDMISGYAQANGALGFPGYGWGLIVRQERSAALAGATQLRRVLIAFGVVAAVVIGLVAYWRARRVSMPVKAIAADAGRAAQDLMVVSSELIANSVEAANQAQLVAVAGEQLAAGVVTVASALNELDATFQEVARSASLASRSATTAVDTVAASSGLIGDLDSSSQAIGSVIDVIVNLASQTNLLALNATIEASRAGDAGKGFAVVANEVKELSKQTSAATGNISAMIEAIQTSAGKTVAANRSIAEAVDQIREHSMSIASATEQQSATVAEIARVMAASSRETDGIVQSNVALAASAKQTTASASTTEAASEVARQIARKLAELVSGAGKGAAPD